MPGAVAQQAPAHETVPVKTGITDAEMQKAMAALETRLRAEIGTTAQRSASPAAVPVSLQGSKKIKVVIRPARGHTVAGANLLPSALTPLCPNLRQVKKAGDFEGVVSFGLGLTHKTGFRVFRLTGPNRIVIDVAH